MNITLYSNTIRKFPSHSISPKSPSKSKLVMPKISKEFLESNLDYFNLGENSPNILERSGNADVRIKIKALLAMRCVRDVIRF